MLAHTCQAQLIRSAPVVTFLRAFVSRKPRLSEKKRAQKFIDHKTVMITSGKGGDGCSLFHRDKLTEFGGPSGGNGGKGGDIIFVSSSTESSLDKLNYAYRAMNGQNGGNNNWTGKSAAATIIKVPVGTQLRCHESNQLLADFTEEGEEYIACVGGFGGKGNSYFASSLNTIPKECTRGQNGTNSRIDVELCLLADAGLVGFPNAGKSTLLQALTRARPAIADYEFTTLSPHIGVVEYDDYQQISLADLPGIIFQAHKNKGLGFRFLCHIKRCRFLLFVIDLSVPQPWKQMFQLKEELQHFNYTLNEKPAIILANKIDKDEAKLELEHFLSHMSSAFPSYPVIPVSGKAKLNIKDISDVIRKTYDNVYLK